MLDKSRPPQPRPADYDKARRSWVRFLRQLADGLENDTIYMAQWQGSSLGPGRDQGNIKCVFNRAEGSKDVGTNEE